MVASSAHAAIITVTDAVSVNGFNGTFQFSYDSTETGTDSAGSYVDPTHGLLTFDLSIAGYNFTESQVYGEDSSYPVVLLPGNADLNADAPGGYSAEGLWWDTVTGVAFGVGRLIPADEFTGVTGVSVSGPGSDTVTTITYNGSVFEGTLSATNIAVPEPSGLTVLGVSIAGIGMSRSLRRR